MFIKANERYQYFDNNRRGSGLLRYCKYCGQPIRFELFEDIKILNPHSWMFWKIVKSKRWMCYDWGTSRHHKHYKRQVIA